jgi:electron transport complex protein RnfA
VLLPAARHLPAADHDNCAILGLALFRRDGASTSPKDGVCARRRFGLTLALSLLASIRERMEVADVPVIARRMGLVLIAASALSMAFMGFAGMGSQ